MRACVRACDSLAMSRKTILFALASIFVAASPWDQAQADEPMAAAAMHALVITGSSNVTFTGYIDGSGDLEFRYGTLELSDYGDSVVIESDVTVTVNLREPVGDGLSASHQEGGQTITWASESWGVLHRFATGMANPLQVDVAPDSDPSPPKNIFIHIKQTGGL